MATLPSTGNDSPKGVERPGTNQRTLVGVKVCAHLDTETQCVKAAYNSETKEVICFSDANGISVFTVFGVSGYENDQLKPKRTMRWDKLRGRNEYALWDVCMVSGNSLYGVVLDTKRGGNTVEELDQFSLKKKSHLDTTGLLNRDSAIWCLTSKDDTIALAVLDIADDSQRWCSVTLFKNKLRVFTALLDERSNKYVSRSACTLINDSVLILSCGLCHPFQKQTKSVHCTAGWKSEQVCEQECLHTNQWFNSDSKLWIVSPFSKTN